MKLRFLDFLKYNRIPSNLDKSEIEMNHQKQDSAYEVWVQGSTLTNEKKKELWG